MHLARDQLQGACLKQYCYQPQVSPMYVLRLLCYDCPCPGDSLGRLVIGVAVALIAGIREVGGAERTPEGVFASIDSRQSQINSRIIAYTCDVDSAILPILLYSGTGFDKADLTRFIRSTA